MPFDSKEKKDAHNAKYHAENKEKINLKKREKRREKKAAMEEERRGQKVAEKVSKRGFVFRLSSTHTLSLAVWSIINTLSLQCFHQNLHCLGPGPDHPIGLLLT